MLFATAMGLGAMVMMRETAPTTLSAREQRRHFITS
jgi:hypothetical protein